VKKAGTNLNAKKKKQVNLPLSLNAQPPGERERDSHCFNWKKHTGSESSADKKKLAEPGIGRNDLPWQ